MKGGIQSLRPVWSVTSLLKLLVIVLLRTSCIAGFSEVTTWTLGTGWKSPTHATWAIEHSDDSDSQSLPDSGQGSLSGIASQPPQPPIHISRNTRMKEMKGETPLIHGLLMKHKTH